MPPATASVTICRKCNAYIAFHFHQAELKRQLAEAQYNTALIFYTTLMTIKGEIDNELPGFRGVVFSLSALFGDTPQQQESIREMRDDGGPLLIPGRTLEELFTLAMSSQKRLKSVFSALEERLAGIQAASSDTKTQQRMIANLKQAMHDFLQHSLPLFRFSAQRLAEIRDHPKTRRLLVVAKEQIRQEEIDTARRIQEAAERKRYQELVGDNGGAPAFAPGAGANLAVNKPTAERHSLDSSKSSSSHKHHGGNASNILSAAWHSLSKPMENLNASHYIPEIKGVIPAICPLMGGLPLAIKGINFHPNARVTVGNKRLEEWQVLWKSDQELTIISPQIDSEGCVDIIVENPNQSERGVLQDVLYYSNDPAIMESLFDTAALDINSAPAPRKSTAPSSSSSHSTSSSYAPPTSTSPPSRNAFSEFASAAQPIPSQPPGYTVSHSPPSFAEPPAYIAAPSANSTLSRSPPPYMPTASASAQYALPPGYTSAPGHSAPHGYASSPVSSTNGNGSVVENKPPSGKVQIRARTFGHKEPRVITLNNSNEGTSWYGSPSPPR